MLRDQNIRFARGAAVKAPFQIENAAGVPLDISGRDLAAHVARIGKLNDPAVTKTTPEGIIILSDVADPLDIPADVLAKIEVEDPEEAGVLIGWAYVDFASADTATLQRDGPWHWDVWDTELDVPLLTGILTLEDTARH